MIQVIPGGFRIATKITQGTRGLAPGTNLWYNRYANRISVSYFIFNAEGEDVCTIDSRFGSEVDSLVNDRLFCILRFRASWYALCTH